VLLDGNALTEASGGGSVPLDANANDDRGGVHGGVDLGRQGPPHR
jgi:hypothetical protein